MRSASELMAMARGTMMKWPVLWLPPILMNMAQSLSAIPLTSTAAQYVSAATANLGAMIINAGWLAMIGVGLADEKPTFETFMTGVNRRWVHMLIGSLVFVLLLGAGLAAVIYYGDRQIGIQPMREWYEGIAKMTQSELNAALQPDKLPRAVKDWMYLFMGWMAYAAVVTFSLLFWQPLVAIRDMPWWKAFLTSFTLVFRRFFQTLGFALLHLIAFMSGLSIVAGGNPLVALFGLTMLLFVSIFFKCLYAAVVVDALPPVPAPGTAVDVQA